uniref:Uncharacterized protein n=1 Tax=Arundo donax TaxID=35708 RepID=A0A0A9ASP4_ARUDO
MHVVTKFQMLTTERESIPYNNQFDLLQLVLSRETVLCS